MNARVTRSVLLTLVVTITMQANQALAQLQAGAAIVDVTPVNLPVLVNGGMLSRTVNEVNTRLHARALVLDAGDERIAIVVVDSCMIPRPLLDDAKQLASQRTQIKPDRMLISATHTHTAPASMSCLGTDADPTYVPYLREKLAEAIAAAEARLEPAELGWGEIDAAEHTALRRWIRRPDRLGVDPFGNPTMRANMHSGRNWEDVVGESGPEDPQLSMISVRSRSGRPIALLCNYSMHYFGDRALSADYFGLFCNRLEQEIAPDSKANEGTPSFVAIMSHGCSGDIWRRDYKVPAEKRNDGIKIDEYALQLADIALTAYKSIEYQSTDVLAMAEARMQLRYRTPNKQLLQWAEQTVEAMGDRPPKTQTEVYAKEQLILHERQSTEIVVQGLRVGDIAIATTPNETYALTGLKIKHQSPLEHTMVIELANGGDGYIPPPEQHLLGGYNTWAARSAGLEVQAEPKIVEAGLSLLEQAAGQPRRIYDPPAGPRVKAVIKARPVAYYRLHEWAGPHARDSSGRQHHALYEPRVAYFLDGPDSRGYTGDALNRCPHFVDARLRAMLPTDSDYTVSMWIWNGLPLNARETAGWFFSRGRDHSLRPEGEHLGVGGKQHAGRLVLHSQTGAEAQSFVGKSKLERWQWYQVVLVRRGDTVRVYLGDNEQPEIEAKVAPGPWSTGAEWFFAGRCDRNSNWEGRIDEVAVFDRALSPEEIRDLTE